MNDGLLRVNFTSLAGAGASIKNAVDKLDTQLSQLKADAKPLVETWDGKAKAAYLDRQHKWDAAATDLKTILHDIGIAVDRSAQDYAQTESKAEQRFL